MNKKIIEISVKECKGKIPVIAGTGSNSTDEAVDLSRFAEKAGQTLLVTPYYNKLIKKACIIIKKLMIALVFDYNL